MQFKLIEIFNLFITGLFSLNNGFSGGISGNKSFINGIKYSTFYMMMKIESCLMLVCGSVIIEQFLVRNPVNR